MAPMFKQIEAIEIAAILTDLESKEYTASELKLIFKEVQSKIKILFAAIEKQLN